MISGEIVKNTDDVAGAIDRLNKSSSKLEKSLEKVTREGIGTFIRSLEEVALGSKSAGDAVREMLRSILSSVLDRIANEIENIGKPKENDKEDVAVDLIGSLISSIGFRAEGGMVAPNSAFIVGEKGPELLVTGNSSGQVISNANLSNNNTGGVQVNVNNYSKADVSVNEKSSANGDRNIEITIDDMVANAISSPASKTGKALKNIYGVDPVLLRR